jgi:hypothetical protein
VSDKTVKLPAPLPSSFSALATDSYWSTHWCRLLGDHSERR